MTTETKKQTQAQNADECPMMTKPQKEHNWLDQLIGEWSYEGACDGGPDQPPMQFKGVETVRSIGGLWIQAEGKGTSPDGSEMTSILNVGYDTRKKCYVGSWLCSMMDHMFVYEGKLDNAEKVLPLETEGPHFMDPTKTSRYRDIIEFVSPDHRVMRSEVQGDDGKWTQMVKADYKRVK